MVISPRQFLWDYGQTKMLLPWIVGIPRRLSWDRGKPETLPNGSREALSTSPWIVANPKHSPTFMDRGQPEALPMDRDQAKHVLRDLGTPETFPPLIVGSPNTHWEVRGPPEATNKPSSPLPNLRWHRCRKLAGNQCFCGLIFKGFLTVVRVENG